jgi:SNF2 family DNA or RNA helicase
LADNWKKELSIWCPSLNVLNYYGSQNERYQMRTDILKGRVDFDVILTTYNMVVSSREDRGLFKLVFQLHFNLVYWHDFVNSYTIIFWFVAIHYLSFLFDNIHKIFIDFNVYLYTFKIHYVILKVKCYFSQKCLFN